jgi:hypothetical protein
MVLLFITTILNYQRLAEICTFILNPINTTVVVLFVLVVGGGKRKKKKKKKKLMDIERGDVPPI